MTLNSLFLETRPIDLDAAVALSHELFGHLVAETAARAAGEDILLVYQGFSSDNETYANLVGWIVSLELGRRPDLHEARLFVSNRAQYYDALWKRNDWTAPLLTSDQMLRPAAEFNRRRLEARELFQRTHDPSLEPILAKLEKIARIFSDGENERDLNGRFASAARSSFILEQSRQVQELSSRFEILWRNQKD